MADYYAMRAGVATVTFSALKADAAPELTPEQGTQEWVHKRIWEIIGIYADHLAPDIHRADMAEAIFSVVEKREEWVRDIAYHDWS